MSTKFLHYRALNQENSNWLSNCGATVAFVPAPEDKGGGYYYALAWCGPRDNYSKRLGRAKAGGRLNSADYRFHISADDFQHFLRQIDDEIGQHGYVRKSKPKKI